MKLHDAIDILHHRAQGRARLSSSTHEKEAAALGAEALKRIRDIRLFDGDYSNLVLPGETPPPDPDAPFTLHF